jgi:hypothetical protein
MKKLMKLKHLLSLCAVLVMALTTVSAHAADVTGTWTGAMTGGNGDFNITFTFKQDGAKLTGTILGPQGDPIEISNGTVDGDKLSFTVSFNEMTITHTGVITGDTIKLTTKSNNPDFPTREMTLTRSK